MKHEIINEQLILHGSLSLEEIHDLKEVMDKNISGNSRNMVIDLTNIESIDTSVVQFFVSFKIDFEKQDKSVQFINLADSLKKNIELLSLEGFFDEATHTGVI